MIKTEIIAGSYRRKKKDSGDIDILLKAKDSKTYESFIQKLIETGYIRDTCTWSQLWGISNININEYCHKVVELILCIL